MRRPLRSSLVALALLTSCRSGPPPVPARPATAPAAAPLRIVVVGTNDLHGWVAPHATKLASGVELKEGGLTHFAGYLARLRTENPDGLVLLDGGDLFQGTLPSNTTEGAVVIDVYNYLGYAAAAVGNHEFDYGPVGPVPVATRPGEDPFGALKARIAQAKFPIMAANIREVAGGAVPGWLGNDGTALIERQGLKIGIVGLATPTTPSTTNPVNVASLRFNALAEETAAAVKRLRARGAELVLGVAHAGGRCTELSRPRDLSSCERATSEIFSMLEALPPRTLDAVVAGHTHAALGHFVQETPVIETSGMGRSFGLVELHVDRVSRRVLPERTRIEAAIPICAQVDEASGSCDPRVLGSAAQVRLVPARFHGAEVVPDDGVERILAPVLQSVAVQQQEPLGVTVPVTLTRDYHAESPLGSVLVDALRAVGAADVALLNPGGLRADLREGPVTYGDLFEVLPFENTLSTLTLTGAQLTTLLRTVYAQRKGVFQVSGLRVTLDRCLGDDRFKGATLLDGRKLLPAARYRVVLPDFLARGGEGLEPFLATLAPEQIDLGEQRPLSLRDALAAHWKREGKPLAAPAPGRIRYLGTGKQCGPEKN